MDNYTRQIIESWMTLILTLLGIILGAILLIYAMRYVRALLKRASFMRRLKMKCREKNVTLKKLSSPYLSIFRKGGSSELLLEKDGKLYTVKLFACIHPKDTYRFDAEGNYHRISNFKPIYLRQRSPFYWGQADKSTRKYLTPSMLRYHDTIIRKSAGTNFRKDTLDNAVPLLCINPTSFEMLKVEGSTVVPIFDGDSLCGYTVYSGGRLLEFKEIFG